MVEATLDSDEQDLNFMMSLMLGDYSKILPSSVIGARGCLRFSLF